LRGYGKHKVYQVKILAARTEVTVSGGGRKDPDTGHHRQKIATALANQQQDFSSGLYFLATIPRLQIGRNPLR
jgi:hypothetical protein